jgi:hypothetical protein
MYSTRRIGKYLSDDVTIQNVRKHADEYEECRLLGCGAVWVCCNIIIFKINPNVATSHNKAFLIVTAVKTLDPTL